MQRYRRFQRDVDTEVSQVFAFETSEDQDKYLVLDGQQRLLSLLIALRGTYNHRRLFIDVLSGSSQDKDPGDEYYDCRFLTDVEATKLNEPNGIKLHCFLALQELVKTNPIHSAKIALTKSQELNLSSDQTDQMTDTYSRCAHIMGGHESLQVHPIDENEADFTPLEEILEIFVRVNSGGLVLQKSDLLMSLLDLKWNDIQPELQQVARELNKYKPFDFSRDDLLKSLLLSLGSDTRFDRLVSNRNLVGDLATKMPGKLPAVKQAWMMLSTILTDDCKIYSERYFRGGHNSLLPFVVFLVCNPSPSQQEKKRIVAGIYIALMSGVFASAEARMATYARNSMRSNQPFPLRKLALLARSSRNITNMEGLLTSHLDLALNITHYGITIEGNPDELQRDHIFPQSTLNDQGVYSWKVNHYANFHLLRAKDNLNKSNIPPHEWFRNPGKEIEPYSDKDLEERLLTWENLEPGAFEQMLEERSRKIKQRAAQMFGMSAEEFDNLFF